jgi:hypothetical protein
VIDEQVSQVCGSEAPLCRAPRPPDAQLRVGDRLADETGEYEVIGRAYATNGGKDVHVRVLRVMLQTRWSAEAWSQVRVEFRKALALRSQIRRAGWFN